MTGSASLVDLLLFYTLERVLFNRMVGSMGKSSQQVKKAIALWLMLEEIGYHDLIRVINSYNNNIIEAIFFEALHCVERIQPNSTGPTESGDTPVFSGLIGVPMNLRLFYYDREFMYNRYMHKMETVCDKIFGETKAIEVDESGSRPVAKPLGEGSSRQGSMCAAWTSSEPSFPYDQISEASRQTQLDPEATEFNPEQAPEDSRTMFLTFSMGHPLSCEEVYNFFTSKWGLVVQDVFIECTQPGQDPQFGRILFTSATVIARILNGQAKAKFMVNGKHLWARIYVPRHRGRS